MGYFQELSSVRIYVLCRKYGAHLLTMNASKTDLGEINLKWDNTKLLWTIVCIIVACAYEGFLAFIYGGNQFEMLASGNFKRATDGEYRISVYKESKEYRPWKGFVIGAFVSIYSIIIGIYFGCNQSAIAAQALTQGGSIVALLGLFISGWSVLPFFFLNNSGVTVSYFYSCLLALLPIVIAGVFYIAGAYYRRNKTIREQKIADESRRAQEEKPKKINYGGLPGTKPKKRK